MIMITKRRHRPPRPLTGLEGEVANVEGVEEEDATEIAAANGTVQRNRQRRQRQRLSRQIISLDRMGA